MDNNTLNKTKIHQSILIINKQINEGRRRKLFLTEEIKLINVDKMRTDEVKKKKNPPFCNHQERIINRC